DARYFLGVVKRDAPAQLEAVQKELREMLAPSCPTIDTAWDLYNGLKQQVVRMGECALPLDAARARADPELRRGKVAPVGRSLPGDDAGRAHRAVSPGPGRRRPDRGREQACLSLQAARRGRTRAAGPGGGEVPLHDDARPL